MRKGKSCVRTKQHCVRDPSFPGTKWEVEVPNNTLTRFIAGRRTKPYELPKSTHCRVMIATDAQLEPTCPHYKHRCQQFLRLLHDRFGVADTFFDHKHDRCYCPACWNGPPVIRGKATSLCTGMNVGVMCSQEKRWKAGRVVAVKVVTTYTVVLLDGRVETDKLSNEVEPAHGQKRAVHRLMKVQVKTADGWLPGEVQNIKRHNVYMVELHGNPRRGL